MKGFVTMDVNPDRRSQRATQAAEVWITVSVPSANQRLEPFIEVRKNKPSGRGSKRLKTFVLFLRRVLLRAASAPIPK
jgi:hypothetical protein